LVIAQIEDPSRDPKPFNCRLVYQQKITLSRHTQLYPSGLIVARFR
jgi:hypothetical protein